MLHSSLGQSLSVGGLEVGRLHLAALVLLDIIGDALVFTQRTHSRALDVGDVDEGVGSATFGLDEAKAFGLVEELDRACGHLKVPFNGGPRGVTYAPAAPQ